MINTTKGCDEISKAANPLSTYLNAQTTTPFPKVKNKNPAMAVLMNCLFVIVSESPINFAMTKMIQPAEMNLIDANINGGSSDTAILFRRYVEPQIT